MFFENLEDAPEQIRAELVESEFEGKKGYQPKQMVALANALNSIKQDKEAIKSKFDEYEAAEKARIEAARKEEREQALKEAEKGNFEQLQTQLEQQIEDAQRRAAESEAQFQERLDKLAERQKQVTVKSLRGHAVDEYGDAFERLISPYIKEDIDAGKTIYLDDEGKATSLDEKGFIEWMKQNPLFKPMLKADTPTQGGGLANGSRGANGSRKPLKDMTEAERLQFKQEDPEGFKLALNRG